VNRNLVKKTFFTGKQMLGLSLKSANLLIKKDLSAQITRHPLGILP
jgi:hypothetical protein